MSYEKYSRIPAIDRVFDIETYSRSLPQPFSEFDYLPFMLRAFRVMQDIAVEAYQSSTFVEDEFERRMKADQ